MIKCLSVLLIFVLSTLISIPQSIAQESSNSTAQYALQLKQLKKDGIGKINPITYGVFYVTSKDQCADYDNQRLEFYQTVIDQYLSLYELAHNQEYAACISEADYYEYFSLISPTVIPVVIMGKNAAQKLLIQQGNHGLYTISGIGSESIIVCACDDDTESWQGSWVLSHELSHLALYQYGAPESVYFTWVHYNEAMSYVCKILDESSFCPEYSTTVTAPSGNPVPVMEIYGQGATAYNMPSNPPQIDVPIFQQPVLEKGLGKAIQVHVLPPTPELNILALVETGGLKPLIIDSELYPVPYNITGGIIQKISADSITKKLTVEVIGGGNGGQLQLEISRKIMDLVQHGKDTRFMVNIKSIDNVNKKLDYVETQTNTEARTLEIGFPLDKSTIEITSTAIMPDNLPIANVVSEKYIHDTLGFEFLIPSGWYAMQGSNPNEVLFMSTNQNMTNEAPDFVIAMSIRNLSESATLSESLHNDCVNVLSYKIMNEIPIREKSSTCDDHNYKAYSFVKDKKIITIAYVTLPPGDEFQEKDFEKLVSTLKVGNPSPIKDTWRQANGFQIYNEKISEDNLKLELKYYSVSQVDKFTVDLKNKQITLTVNESDDFGSTIIPISELFVKPYTTIVDGSKQEVVLIDDEMTGITEIFVPYKKGTHTIKISGNEIVSTLASKSGGGCLIATATYGSELAPQVQQLREIRDSTLLQTESGSAFMESFNEFYYSFSPTIADLERQNPIFKEFVKITITPMLTTLSILNYVEIDSEEKMLGYGISLILLNVGMYFVAPVYTIIQLKKKLESQV